MDPEKQKQNENQSSLSDHGITKTIARKTFTVLRSISTAGGSGAGAAGVAIAVILIILLITIITTISGGGAYVNAGTPPSTEPPVVATTCQAAGGQCKTTCATDETENTIVTDCSPNKCCVPNSPPIPPPSDTTSLIYWGQTIGDALEKADNCSKSYPPYNKQIQNISSSHGNAATSFHGSCSGNSGYICTRFIIDSYKLAGFGFAQNPLVRDMETNWENGWGGKVYYHSGCYFDNKPKDQNFDVDVLNSLRPGDVIFMHSADCTTMGHVAMVSEQPHIVNGDGAISFINANGPFVNSRLYVRNNKIQGLWGADLFEFGFAPR